MKVVLLAGGFGTRISEESHLKPKPMIEIGGRPILWHIMKIYSHYGFNDFIICGGYKADYIKDYFANYYLRTSDVTFDFTKENPEEALQILLDYQNAENFPLSPAVETESLKILLPAMEKETAEFMSQDVAVWQQNADWLYERGILSEQTDVSFLVADLLAE